MINYLVKAALLHELIFSNKHYFHSTSFLIHTSLEKKNTDDSVWTLLTKKALNS